MNPKETRASPWQYTMTFAGMFRSTVQRRKLWHHGNEADIAEQENQRRQRGDNINIQRRSIPPPPAPPPAPVSLRPAPVPRRHPSPCPSQHPSRSRADNITPGTEHSEQVCEDRIGAPIESHTLRMEKVRSIAKLCSHEHLGKGGNRIPQRR